MSAAKKREMDEPDKSEYDWNVKAKYLTVGSKVSNYPGYGTIDWGDDEPPNDNDNLPLDVVDKFKLNHGDILQ